MLAFGMPEGLTKKDVERIASLARLELTDEEKDLYTRQLADILGYAQQIGTVDTSGVPATAHVLGRQPVERPDELRPSFSQTEALADAPDRAPGAGLFRVPRVIG